MKLWDKPRKQTELGSLPDSGGSFLSGQSGEGRKRRQSTLSVNLTYASSAKSVLVKPSDVLK